MRTCSWVVTLGVLALATGCSGDDDKADETTPSATATTAEDGSTLPGTTLAATELATVNFDAGKKGTTQLRLGIPGIRHGKIADLAQFDLTDAEKDSNVFYVTVAVSNLGQTNIGGSLLKLFGQVSDTLVVQPVMFGSTFTRCNYGPLPAKFGHGAKTKVCMVFLAPKHGQLAAVEWRTDDPDVAPISWAAGAQG